MDWPTALGVGAFIFQFVVIIGGTYAFVLNREAKMLSKVEDLHKEQNCRIDRTEEEMKAIRTNYITKFAEVRQDVNEGFAEVRKDANDVKTEMINAMHSFETAIRSSIHGLREDIAKWFGKADAARNQ